jgi:hypothetical protein
MPRLIIGLLMAACAALVPGETYLQWEDTENSASYRTYTAHGAVIVTVDEYLAGNGEDGGRFEDWIGEAEAVTMHGRALDGVIIIRPMVAGCWSLQMTSDDPALVEDWISAIPCAGRAYLPIVTR